MPRFFGYHYRMTDKMLDSAPSAFPATSADFYLDGPAGQLEVTTDVPEAEIARQGTVIICHPHPVHGGTMRNKVVTMIERALRESGLATVRFNFRGVNRSAGEFDDGRGENDDLLAIIDWVRQVQPDDALWLAGFSFGSYIALNNATAQDAAALITVAPPVGRDGYGFDAIELPTCPWLIIQGEEDEVVNAQDVFDWVETLSCEPTLIRMPETSHFFHRRLMDLRGAIKNAVRTWLPPEREA